MFWCDKLVEGQTGPVTINDSKTPSGRAHIGALRGPLIHDAIFRTLQAKGVPVRYLFGVDDYDPVDEIPYGQAEVFEKYLGAPLCNVPPPPGSKASDMAEHFISEFFGVFAELGIPPGVLSHARHLPRGKIQRRDSPDSAQGAGSPPHI